MVRILVFGDSITYGAWDRKGGWVQRLRSFIDDRNIRNPKFYGLVFNLGISGDKSYDIIRRMDFEARQRLDEDVKEKETVFVIAIGGNDSVFDKSINRNRTTEEKFKSNVRKLIETARKYTKKIVFVGLGPADETKTTPVPWRTDLYYRNKLLKKYNDIVKSVCGTEKIHFIDVYSAFIGRKNYRKLLEDGIHPNDKGHELIFKEVKGILIKKKII